ncbi:MAG: hypothetical protein KF904_21585, partial [Rhodoblastus sp.]|nr:hypothetical protein [Rhodoblastus sp.]
MRILGIVSETHDSGLALLEDGRPVLVLEEERLSRIKHSQDFPRMSVAAAIERGLRLDDIDTIATPWKISRLRKTFLKAVLRNAPASLNLLRPGAQTAQKNSIVLLNFWLKYGLRKGFGQRRLPPLVNIPHHNAHAGIYFVSPFEEGNVLVMDGYGDAAATSAFVGTGSTLKRQWQGEFFNSIGMVYTFMTAHLGFRAFEEGTVMALA